MKMLFQCPITVCNLCHTDCQGWGMICTRADVHLRYIGLNYIRAPQT